MTDDDMAPVGYVTIDTKGWLREANLTVATMLAASRATLLKHPLSQFIVDLRCRMVKLDDDCAMSVSLDVTDLSRAKNEDAVS